MLKNIKIEALDHFGRGISHVDNKVVFIKNALKDEIVDIEITSSKKNYNEAKVKNYVKKSADRIKSICLYFGECGGCDFLCLNYDKTLKFKQNKALEVLNKNHLSYDGEVKIIKNSNQFNYRNKITLKIKNGHIGYYEDSTHNLIEVDSCLVAKKEINQVIKNISLLNLVNGLLTIRCNTNNEILLIIESNDKDYNIELEKLRKIVKLVGIIYNDKLIYGEDFFYERIYGMLFKVSYNSFFQVNHFITEELFKLIEENIDYDSIVLDLYSGVGTLGLVASKKASEVISVEIIPNAVKNGIINAKLNHSNNIKFLLGDVSHTVKKINKKFNTLIVDPPRKGLDKNTIEFIKENKIDKIIYVSCDMFTLIRDLKYLEDLYEIKEYKLLDMFSYSYHVENVCVLNRR